MCHSPETPSPWKSISKFTAQHSCIIYHILFSKLLTCPIVLERALMTIVFNTVQQLRAHAALYISDRLPLFLSIKVWFNRGFEPALCFLLVVLEGCSMLMEAVESWVSFAIKDTQQIYRYAADYKSNPSMIPIVVGETTDFLLPSVRPLGLADHIS